MTIRQSWLRERCARGLALTALSAIILACGASSSANAVAERASAASALPGGKYIEGTAWVTRSPMPTHRNAFGIAELNGEIYVVGGWAQMNPGDVGGVTGALEVYDTVRDEWITRASMPTPRNALAAAFLDGKLYAIGGWDGSAVTNKVEVYDPRTDAWSTGTAMNVPKSAHSATVFKGKLYVAGGPVVEVYDPRTDTWTTTASSNWFPRSFLALAVANGKIFAIGGSEVSDPMTLGALYDVVQSYDPASDSWSDEPPMRFARALHAAAVVGDTIYVVGGLSDWWTVWINPFLATVDAFHAAAGRWTPRGQMGIGRNALGAVTANGRVYAVGGWQWLEEPRDLAEPWGDSAASGATEVYAWPEAQAVVKNEQCLVWMNGVDEYGPTLTVSADTSIVVPHATSGRVVVTCRASGASNDTGDWVVLRSDEHPELGCFVYDDWLPAIYEWVEYIAPNGDATLVCTY